MVISFKNIRQGVLTYKDHEIRLVMDTNHVLWVRASDVTAALGYKRYREPIEDHIPKKYRSAFHKITPIGTTIEDHPRSVYMKEAGLYLLLMRSNMPAAVPFAEWVAEDVLPAVRVYGENLEIFNLREAFHKLRSENEGMKKIMNQLTEKKANEAYPDGGMVYVIKMPTDGFASYKVGMTSSMRQRKKVYDSHQLLNQEVVYYVESRQPKILEKCVLCVLKQKKLGNKDIFNCDLDVITTVIRRCAKNIEGVSQSVRITGGCTAREGCKIVSGYKALVRSLIDELEGDMTVIEETRNRIRESIPSYSSIKQADTMIIDMRNLVRVRSLHFA